MADSSKVTHEVSLSFFYLHYNDSLRLRDAAAKETSKLRSMFARHAILAVVFAAEALVNKLLDDFSRLPSGQKHIERLGVREKWILAPSICADAAESFDVGREPLQGFAELVKIRNWFVHPRGKNPINATADGSTISILSTGEEVPLVETLAGGTWPQTNIPRNPFELTAEHATKAIEVVDALVAELKVRLPDLVTEDWLEQIVLRDKSSGEETTITTHSLWGGYTP